jgi:hypothetical protein
VNAQLFTNHGGEKQRFDGGINADSLRIGFGYVRKKKGEPDKLQKNRKGPYLM